MQSLVGSQTEEIIQLMEIGEQPRKAPSGISTHKYHHNFDLFSTFAASPLVSVVTKSKLRAAAAPFIPRWRKREIAMQSSNSSEEPVATQRPVLDSIIPIQTLQAGHSELEIASTIRIQALYRRYRRRVESAKNADPAFVRRFEECFALYQSLKGSSRYRKMVLGPLPHLLVCLDAYIHHIVTQKKEASKKFLLNHLGIEKAVVDLNLLV